LTFAMVFLMFESWTCQLVRLLLRALNLAVRSLARSCWGRGTLHECDTTDINSGWLVQQFSNLKTLLFGIEVLTSTTHGQ
jgi:hypothetical protein